MGFFEGQMSALSIAFGMHGDAVPVSEADRIRERKYSDHLEFLDSDSVRVVGGYLSGEKKIFQ